MAFEDIPGVRTLHTTYRGGDLAAASGTIVEHWQAMVMPYPFTMVGLAVAGGTTNPAGTSTSLQVKVWVNGARKGLASPTITAATGTPVSWASGLNFTGPANSVVTFSLASVGAVTPGTGSRLQLRYVHGHKAP